MKKTDILINALAFTIPMLAIIVQGSYFPVQYICIFSGLLILLIIYSLHHNLYVNKYIVILTTVLSALYIIPVFTIKADLINSVLESIRFMCLALMLILCNDALNKRMLAGVYAGITVISAMGILAYLKLLNINDWACEIDGVFRMQSSVGYANLTAVYCGIGVILSYIYRKKSKDLKSVHSICLFLNSTGMVLTFSRFGMVCFVLSVALTLCFKYKCAIYAAFSGAVLTIIGVSYLFVTRKQALLLGSSLISRIIYWQDGFKLWLEHPLGVGAGEWENWQYAIQSSGYSVKFLHNSLLQIMVDGGIMALIACIFFLAAGISGLIKKWLKTKDFIYLGLLASCFLIISHSLVDIDLSFTATFIILGIFLSYGINVNYEFKRLPIIIVAFILICASVYIGILNEQRDRANDYEFLIAESTFHPDKVSVIASLYNIAYSQNNIDDMYKWSKTWVESAPRQQNAYDAYLVSLDRMIEETSDETYKQEKIQLYKKAEEINKTVNPLCRYYDSYKNIVLPKLK